MTVKNDDGESGFNGDEIRPFGDEKPVLDSFLQDVYKEPKTSDDFDLEGLILPDNSYSLRNTLIALRLPRRGTSPITRPYSSRDTTRLGLGPRS
jgi:hypothetical protein